MPIVGAEPGPEEIIGKAYMDLQAQRISRAEFEDILDRANKMRHVPALRAPETTGYV